MNSENYVDVSNQAALLKRIEMNGVDIGDRWKALAEHSEKRIHDHMLPFRDAHFCLALAANGNFDAARRHIESMAAFSAQGEGWRAEATRDILIPLCEGMIAYEAGDYDKATELLWPMRNEISTIGGSHAQRDLFAQIMCDAAVHSSKLAVARSLLLGTGAEPRHQEEELAGLFQGAGSARGNPERGSGAKARRARARDRRMTDRRRSI